MKGSGRPRSPTKKKGGNNPNLLKPVVLPNAYPEAIRRTSSEYFEEHIIKEDDGADENLHLPMLVGKKLTLKKSFEKLLPPTKPIPLNDPSKHQVDPELERMYALKRSRKIAEMKAEKIANSLTVPLWPIKRNIPQRAWNEMKKNYHHHVHHFRTTLVTLLENHTKEVDGFICKLQSAMETNLNQWKSRLEHWTNHYHTFSRTMFDSHMQEYKFFVLEQFDLPTECQDQLQQLHANTTQNLAAHLEAYYDQTQSLLVPKPFLLLRGTAVAMEVMNELLQHYQVQLDRVGMLKQTLTLFHEQWHPHIHAISTIWLDTHTQYLLTKFQPDFHQHDLIENLLAQVAHWLLPSTLLNLSDLSAIETGVQTAFQTASKAWSRSMTEMIQSCVESSGSDSLADILKSKVPWKKTELWLLQQAKDMVMFLQHFWSKFQTVKYHQRGLHLILKFQQTLYTGSLEKDQYLLNECTSNYETEIQLLEKENEALNVKLNKSNSEMECIQSIQEIKANTIKLEKKHEFYAKEYQSLLNQMHFKHVEQFRLFENLWDSLDITSEMPKDFANFFKRLADYVQSNNVTGLDKQLLPVLTEPLPSANMLSHLFKTQLESSQRDLEEHWLHHVASLWEVATQCHGLFQQWHGDTLTQLHLARTSQLRQLTNQLNERLYVHTCVKEAKAKYGHHRVLELQRHHVQTRNELQKWTEDHQRHRATWTKTMKDVEKKLCAYLLELQGGMGASSSSFGTSTELHQFRRRILQCSDAILNETRISITLVENQTREFEEQLRPTQFYSFLEPFLIETFTSIAEGRIEIDKLVAKLQEVTKLLVEDLDGMLLEMNRVQEIIQQFTKLKLEIKTNVLQYQFELQCSLATLNKKVESLELTVLEGIPELMDTLGALMKEIEVIAQQIELPVPSLTKFIHLEHGQKQTPPSSSHLSQQRTGTRKKSLLNSSDHATPIVASALAGSKQKGSLDTVSQGPCSMEDKKLTSSKAFQTQCLETLEQKLTGMEDSWAYKKAMASPMSKTSLYLDALAVHALSFSAYEEIKEYLAQFVCKAHEELQQCIRHVHIKLNTVVEAGFKIWDTNLLSRHASLQEHWQSTLIPLVDQSKQLQATWNAQLSSTNDQVDVENMQKEVRTWFEGMEQWYQSLQSELNSFTNDNRSALFSFLEIIAPASWFMSSTPLSSSTSMVLPDSLNQAFSDSSLSSFVCQEYEKASLKLDFLVQECLESMKKQMEISKKEQVEWKESWDLAMNLIRSRSF